MKNLQVIYPDRISALPEPIIHRILLLLPSKSVKLASSLSKTWYDFCSSLPYLDFDDYDHSFESMYPDDITSENFIDEDDFNPYLKPLRERYLNYIGESLHRFHERNPGILIRRIKIPITLINSTFVSMLGDWIQLTLEHGVEKIDLRTRGYCFDLTREVFTSNSIRVLKLGGCSLLNSFGHGDISVSRSKLRKLVMDGVCIDEPTLGSIISICPLMEKLAIEDAMGLTNLHISGHYKVKSLAVSNVITGKIKMVEVDAPILRCLEISNSTSFGCPLIKIRFLECPRLTNLTLNDVEVDSFQLEEISSSLPFLGCLRLTNLPVLTKFKISNNSLNKLTVIGCKHLVELEIDAPSLLLFEFDSNSVPLMAPMHTIKGKSNVTLVQKPSLYENFGVKFSNFLSYLDCVNYLLLHLKDFAMIGVDEPEERVMQPVIDIEEMEIIVQMPSCPQDIFNGLIRSYRPRILRMKLELFENSDVMTFLRDIMLSGDPCCAWLPYLDELMIVANVNRLPMDETAPSIALENHFWVIKFVFKW